MKKSRRQFLKNVGMASSALMAQPSLGALSSGMGTARPSDGDAREQPGSEKDLIRVRNPRKLGSDRLEAERIRVGVKGHYKPCIAKLDGDGLLLVCYLANAKGLPSYQYRSRDGGRTWSGPEQPGLDGGEPYLSRFRDGTLLGTGGLWGGRSEDGGRTWIKRLLPEDFAARAGRNLSRNILQLKDGSRLQIVNIPKEKGKLSRYGDEHIARSTDGGRTWPETYPVKVNGVPEGYPYPIFDEAHLWQAPSGKLYAIARVDHRYYRLPGRALTDQELGNANLSMLYYGVAPVKDIAETDFDDFNRMKVFFSTDLGRTWQPSNDLGDYACHYPSILRLHDGRLLLTFTVRAIAPPLGVRAVVGKEDNDGFRFGFEHDIIMVDTRNPIGRCSGGGFGPTVQLDDGTLVTSYSYWSPDDKRKAGDWSLPTPHVCEVVRWHLPART